MSIDAGHAEDAREALAAASEDAERHGLAFAEPRVRLLQARLDMLRRQFNRAALKLQQVESQANNDEDALDAVRSSKLALSLMQRRSSTEDASSELFGRGNRYICSQTLVLRALEEAIGGDPSLSAALSDKALAMWDAPYVRNVQRFARAIAMRRAGSREADDFLSAAASTCLETGDVFNFVCVYRACPDILPTLLADTAVTPATREIVARFDPDIARHHGLPEALKPQTQRNTLSPRENEVLALLTEGLTNREIARRLFISEATAKLHVRRICAKLGVRSRTEAVLAVVG
jgi:DNA-binding NarL/FixJ family response regulator